MSSLLNLGGLLNVGNGQQPPSSGAVDVVVPGVIDVSLLPGSGGAGALGGLVGGVTGGAGGVGGLLGGVTGGAGGVGGTVGGVVDTAGGLLGGVTGGVGGVGGTAGGALNTLTGTVGGLLNGTSGLSTLLGSTGTGVQNLVSGLGAAAASTGKGLGDLLSNLLNGANGPGVVIVNIDNGVTITGTPSNDFLQGTAGNDRLFGGGGDDILDGLGGFDIGVYQGNHTDYTITSANGTVTVKDATLLRDGTDTLRNMEFLQFKDGGVDLATNTFVAQSILNQATTGYRAIVREDAPGGVAETVGVGIAQNKFTFDQYVDALVKDAKTSTIPALLMPGLVQGTIPTSDKLDSLTAFAKEQFAYYKNVLGSAFAELGPYEALGRGLSTTTEFQAKYSGGTDQAFVAKAYVDVFGTGPSAAQQTALLQQVSYFEALYKGAGLSEAQADVQSRGAVYGQMVGLAADIVSQPYFDKADVLLTGFANGDTSHYGAVFA